MLLSADVSGVVVVDPFIIVVVIGDVPGVSLSAIFVFRMPFLSMLLFAGGFVGTPVCSNLVVVSMLSSLMVWFVVSRCWLCYPCHHFAYPFLPCLSCPWNSFECLWSWQCCHDCCFHGCLLWMLVLVLVLVLVLAFYCHCPGISLLTPLFAAVVDILMLLLMSIGDVLVVLLSFELLVHVVIVKFWLLFLFGL